MNDETTHPLTPEHPLNNAYLRRLFLLILLLSTLGSEACQGIISSANAHDIDPKYTRSLTVSETEAFKDTFISQHPNLMFDYLSPLHITGIQPGEEIDQLVKKINLDEKEYEILFVEIPENTASFAEFQYSTDTETQNTITNVTIPFSPNTSLSTTSENTYTALWYAPDMASDMQGFQPFRVSLKELNANFQNTQNRPPPDIFVLTPSHHPEEK